MHLSVLILWFSTLLQWFISFIGLPFAKGDRAFFPMAVLCLASIVSWVWVDGLSFPDFYPIASERHTVNRSAHISNPSA